MSELTTEDIRVRLESHAGHRGDGSWISSGDFERGMAALERGDIDVALAVVRQGDTNARRWEETYGYAAQQRRSHPARSSTAQ